MNSHGLRLNVTVLICPVTLGKVYDVTKYLDDHPGGPEIICDVAGNHCWEKLRVEN